MQTLGPVLSITNRTAHCPQPMCPGFAMRLLSAHGQRIAMTNSTYGYDVLARIGWLRQMYHATYEQIHADLRRQICLSPSHVRYLYQ